MTSPEPQPAGMGARLARAHRRRVSRYFTPEAASTRSCVPLT